jgi:hypothetical protein
MSPFLDLVLAVGGHEDSGAALCDNALPIQLMKCTLPARSRKLTVHPQSESLPQETPSRYVHEGGPCPPR